MDLRRPQHSQCGFTLVEVMIAVALLGIVLSIAMPSFQALIANHRVKSAADALATSVMFARAEAIKRNAPVLLTRQGTGWGAGWTVAAKSDASALRVAKPTGAVITGYGNNTIEITRTGRISSAVTMTVCDESDLADRRVVVISFSGMTRVTKGERCGV